MRGSAIRVFCAAASLAAVAVVAVRAATAPPPPARPSAVASPVVTDADGYAAIPGAAVPPDKARVYKAIFDATRSADKPAALVPAINMAGSELNALAVAGVPAANAKFVIVFHGAAMDGILDDAHYRAKFGIANPNRKAIGQLRKAGVELLVCGQNLLSDKIDAKTLLPEIRVASDALIVLMAYQGDGYALMSF